MKRLWAHMRTLWPRWTLLPALPFFVWVLFWGVRGELRWEQFALFTIVCVLAYTNAKTKKLFWGLLPIGFVGVLYDSMRLVKNWGLSEANVHVCDLRETELKWFGVTADGVRMTMQDYFQANWHIVADVICSIPYGLFIPVIIAYAIYLYFKDFTAQQRFTWTFLLLNVAGFITYHVYPAAPPWYQHQYGCTVDLMAHASEGPNLARVDALLGINWFSGFYGRSSDIFGAVPSLHVAYPLTIVLEGWRRHRVWGRALSVVFYLWMCFSAVYLDHHWVIDILIGSIYAVAAVSLMRVVFAREEEQVAELPARANLGES